MNYKKYMALSWIAVLSLFGAFACNIDLIGLDITGQDVLMFVIIVVGGAVIMGILMIFFVAGNDKNKRG